MDKFLEINRERLKNRNYIFESENDLGEIWKNENEKIFFFLKIYDSIQIKILDNILIYLKNLNIFKANIIFIKNVSASVKLKIDKIKNYDIELICLSSLACNIMNHVNQPYFFLVPKNLEHVIKNKHSFNLPEILYNDPVILWMNWKKGNIIGICENKCKNLINDKGECCNLTKYRIVV